MNFTLTQEAVDWFFNREFGEYTPFADMVKARKICDMRLQGFSYIDIAREVGLSNDRARRYAVSVQNAYKRMLRNEEYQKYRKEKGLCSMKDINQMIEIEYKKAIKDRHIQKPMAYALYQVWKRFDEREKPRC